MTKIRLLGAVTVIALFASAACSDDEGDGAGGKGGSGGSSGKGSGGAGGKGGSTGGSAGSTGGSAGSTGGSAGSTGGSAGSTGGSAGSAGGTPDGSAGAAGATDAGGDVECATPDGPGCYTCGQVIAFVPCAVPPTSCGWDADAGPPGATLSAAKFFAMIACACDQSATNNCYAECQLTCDTREFPTQECQDCWPVACPTEHGACLADTGA